MKAQPKSNFRYEGDHFVVHTEQGGGHVFVHMTANHWNKTIKREVQDVFREVLEFAKNQGAELLFATGETEKSVKFWKSMAPLDGVEKFGPRKQYYLGAWHIKETLDGIRSTSHSSSDSSDRVCPEVCTT